jgi:hypothetical protein
MQNLQDFETDVLIDMLAEQTEKFTRLFWNYTGLQNDPEYQGCKEIIRYIILELGNRGMLSHDLLTPVLKQDGQSMIPI